MSAPSMIVKIQEIYSAQRACSDAHQQLASLLGGGPASFYYEKMADYITGLLSFSKFNIGDRVALVADIDCNDKPGWAHCEHFLRAGRTAVVADLDYSKKGFSYGVEFDRETFIYSGAEREVTEKHQFWILESSLKAIKPEGRK